MLQKPSLEELEGLSKTHLFLMDIGIWILSDRAIEVLMKRSLKEGTNDINYYDLYSDYGLALGEHPKTEDEEINQLKEQLKEPAAISAKQQFKNDEAKKANEIKANPALKYFQTK